MIYRRLFAASVALWCAGARAEPYTSHYSHDGVLSVVLVAEPGQIKIGSLTLDGAAFNGSYVGPVLHVHPGDFLQVRLVNHLPEPTNLHFHGLRTSPLGDRDNAHLSIPPDTSFGYRLRIPETQPEGLFWYHTHIHGLASRQVMSGLSGLLVVEPAVQPTATERFFVLKDMVFDDDTGNPYIDDQLQGVVQSVNGGLTTAEHMRPGEVQLWRFSNHSANRAVHIALEGHRFRIVAKDGEPVLDRKETDVLDMHVGSRFDVQVRGQAAGRYRLLAKGLMTGTGPARTPDRTIGDLEIGGDPRADPDIPPAKSRAQDLRGRQPDAKREVVFSQTEARGKVAQQFFLNGRTYDAARMDLRVPLGNVEEWTIRNDSDDTHVFHIHQIGFQVVAENGVAKDFGGYVDTVYIPERGSVTLRLPFTDPLILGRFMFHCHVLKHEDGGMMANIEIYDPAPQPLATRIKHFYMRVVWWFHGVPWSQCGFADA